MVVFWCLFVCFFKVVGLGGGGVIQVHSLCLCNYALVKQSILVSSPTQTSSWSLEPIKKCN